MTVAGQACRYCSAPSIYGVCQQCRPAHAVKLACDIAEAQERRADEVEAANRSMPGFYRADTPERLRAAARRSRNMADRLTSGSTAEGART